SDASEWSTEWQDVADLWKPNDDKDKWRAFEPAKDSSTIRWWEGTLDDDLWSQKSPESLTGKYEDVSSTSLPSTDSTKPFSQNEQTASNTSQTAPPAVSSSTVIADSDSGQPTFKKGEVNTFAEPDPGNYYRSSGESYGGKIWDSAYSDFSSQRNVQQDMKNHNHRFKDTNAIYGKGARLPVPHAGSVNSAVVESMPKSTTRKQEEATTKKSNSQFKDWDDWDNSAFDYYDDKNEENKDNKKDTRLATSKDFTVVTVL
ncbi:unnamed protein product, partial [Candidula unifasciata]